MARDGKWQGKAVASTKDGVCACVLTRGHEWEGLEGGGRQRAVRAVVHLADDEQSGLTTNPH